MHFSQSANACKYVSRLPQYTQIENEYACRISAASQNCVPRQICTAAV